jgi:hypothetical protein
MVIRGKVADRLIVWEHTDQIFELYIMYYKLGNPSCHLLWLARLAVD